MLQSTVGWAALSVFALEEGAFKLSSRTLGARRSDAANRADASLLEEKKESAYLVVVLRVHPSTCVCVCVCVCVVGLTLRADTKLLKQ